MKNLFSEKQSLGALLRDIKRAIQGHQYEVSPVGIEISRAKIMIGGIFDISASRHEKVQQAIDNGDKDAESFWRKIAMQAQNVVPHANYFEFDSQSNHNLMPTAGRNFMLNALVGPSSTARKSLWYPSAYLDNYSPGAGWDANWAGASSGIGVTEINAAYVTATVRQTATFGAASAASIAMSASVAYTVKTGVTGLAVYGGTLNSSNEFNYNVAYNGTTGHVLLAATKREVGGTATPVTGLAEADLINIAYTLSATST